MCPYSCRTYASVGDELGALFGDNVACLGQLLQEDFAAVQHELLAFVRRFVVERGECDEAREQLAGRNDLGDRVVRLAHRFHGRLNGRMKLLHRVN